MSAGEYEREGIGAAPDAETVLAFEVALRLHAERYRIRPRLVNVAAPAAGADWSFDVPGGVIWFIQTIRAKFVADANAGTRSPEISIKTPDQIVYTLPLMTTATANAVRFYTYQRALGAVFTGVGVGGQAAPLPNVPVVGGWTIASATNTIQVGDQWSAILLYVIEIRERQLEERAQAFRAIMDGAHSDIYPGLLLGY